jgi:hypothetical protein
MTTGAGITIILAPVREPPAPRRLRGQAII